MTHAATPSGLVSSAHLTQKQFGAAWPFTHITSGTVRCIPRQGSPGEVIFTPDGGSAPMALNGTALDAGVRDIPKKEWKNNPAIPGAKINIAPLRDPVARACGLA